MLLSLVIQPDFMDKRAQLLKPPELPRNPPSLVAPLVGNPVLVQTVVLYNQLLGNILRTL
ncbi:hypothetical protein D3C73_1357940 [compost metagenome]